MERSAKLATTISGRVVPVRRGGRPPRPIVAATRLATLRQAAPAAPAPAEAQAIPAADGSFVITLPPSLPGLEAVVVFTVSPLYLCAVFGGKQLPAGWPTAGQLLSAGPQPLDARLAPAAELAVQPAVEHEPYTEMVAMRDGVRLATEIFLPDAAGPWPAVVVRTPYYRLRFQDLAAMLLAHGYAVVVQDMRGRFDSGGEDRPFAGCGWGGQPDGYDTVEWVARQPWCNGRVATVGASAMGITQYLLAPTAPPHLICQVIAVGAPSLYHYALYPGGLFRKEQIEEWLRANGFAPDNFALYRAHYRYNELYAAYDAQQPERVAAVQVPALHLGGWFDTFQQGTLDGFWARQHCGGPGARGKQWLVMGPWPHALGGRQAGEITWPENAAWDPWEATVRFLDYWLRGQDKGLGREPPVRYYCMGAVGEPGAPGNEWRTASDWPPPAQPQAWYLHPAGLLWPQPPTTSTGHETLHHDPYDPVPTRGGFNLYLPAGPYDQRPVEQRSDVLAWTSPPLSQPLAVVGRVRARLWVSSNCPDTDFIVKLCDVYPDGRSLLITSGGLRLRFRHGFDREVLLEPGRIYGIEVDLWSTAYVFNRGHCLRVDIQASDFPHFDVNPGTGEPLHAHTYAQPALNRVYLSAPYPSHVLLPLLEQP
jgi:predicted acyl esterase